ncbi:PKD domain-containing protein [Methanoregula sp.]|uniref:PKD domain-containing protein n=1 Tax=Methanoregula sp. TaxID=2052170 RepID=UPI003562BF14
MMRSEKYSLIIGLIILLAVFAMPGVTASDSTQSGYITVGLAPVAQFNAQYPAYSTVPTLVSFIDSSLGSTPMTYQWDFGDGATSTDQNPVHSYLQRGTYTVTFTVKNAYGTSTAIKKDYIVIGMVPRADFVANPTSGNAPQNVAFTDKSTGIITSWNWDFGDGTSSTVQNPTHTYWSAGVYTVILTASNDFGSSYSTKNQYVTISGNLVSKFSADPATGKAPLGVLFTDRSLGSPTAWKWDFADGSTSALQYPSHTFTTAGLYKVKLTVTRGTDTDTSTQTLNVGGVPQVDFVATPRLVSTGDAIQFTDNSTNSPTSWTWNFGDTAASAEQNPSHSYQLKGIYTVSLTARNTNGMATETKTNYINVGIPPTADFIPVIAPYVIGKVPMPVSFIDKSTGLPTSWKWDFGDGSTSADPNPSHVYQKEGLYTVTLTVKNNFGTDTMVKKDIISVGNGGAVDFTTRSTTVGVGWVVSFKDLSTIEPTQWSWTFGDGTTGSGQNPDHTYHKTGVYDVSLTASSPTITGSITKKQYITVLNIPRADFIADKTRGSAPMAVMFTDKSSNVPTSWKWDFGDGATSTDKNPSHTYTTLGSYSVTLTASNVNGQDSTTKANYIVTTLAPVAAFSADRRMGNAPFLVQFTDQSTNSPTSWKWNFGDGSSSSDQNPRHIYQFEGSYNVSLTATNQYGSDTSFKAGTTAAPTVSITATPTKVSTTAAPTTAATVAATTIPTTQAPLPAAVSIIASVIAVLAIVYTKLK